MNHISIVRYTAKRVVTGVCHDCKKRTRFLSFFQPWYGDTQTCLRCGRRYADGEWMQLGFYRGSRRDNIEGAKKTWRSMPPVSENHYGLEVLK